MDNIIFWPYEISESGDMKPAGKYKVSQKMNGSSSKKNSGSIIRRPFTFLPLRKFEVQFISVPGQADNTNSNDLDFHEFMKCLISWCSGGYRTIYFPHVHAPRNGLVRIGSIENNTFPTTLIPLKFNQQNQVGNDLDAGNIAVRVGDSLDLHEINPDIAAANDLGTLNSLCYAAGHPNFPTVLASDPNVVTVIGSTPGYPSRTDTIHYTHIDIPKLGISNLPLSETSVAQGTGFAYLSPGFDPVNYSGGNAYVKLLVVASPDNSGDIQVRPCVVSINSSVPAILHSGNYVSVSPGQYAILETTYTASMSSHEFLSVGCEMSGSGYFNMCAANMSPVDISHDFVMGGSGMKVLEGFSKTAEDGTDVYIEYLGNDNVVEYVPCILTSSEEFKQDGSLVTNVVFEEIG